MSGTPADQEWSVFASIGAVILSIGGTIIGILWWFARMGADIKDHTKRLGLNDLAISNLQVEDREIRNLISQMVTKADLSRLEEKQDRQHDTMLRALMNIGAVPQCRNYSPKD